MTPLFLTGRVGREVACSTQWATATPEVLLRKFLADVGVDLVTDGGYLLIGEKEKIESQRVVVFAYSIAPPESSTQLELEQTARLLLAQLPVRYWSDVWSDRVWLALGYYRVPSEDDTYIVVPTRGDERFLSGSVFKVRLGVPSEVTCLWDVPGIGQLVPEAIEDFDNDGVRDFVFAAPFNDDRPSLVLSGADGHRLLEFIGGDIVVERSGNTTQRVSVQMLPNGPTDGGSFVVSHSLDGRRFLVDAPEKSADESAKDRQDETRASAIGKDEVEALVHAGADPATLHAYVFPDMKLHSRYDQVKIVRAAGSDVWRRLIEASQAGWKPISRDDYPEITLLYIHERSQDVRDEDE
jgi:hypothetical protein